MASVARLQNGVARVRFPLGSPSPTLGGSEHGPSKPVVTVQLCGGRLQARHIRPILLEA